MTSSESFVRRFHTGRPGATSRAVTRTGSYARLAARVRSGARVLDLACGDGALLAELDATAIGIDVTTAELHAAAARGQGTRVAAARAQALPFAARRFDVVTCHLAFMVLADLPAVVRELERVLAPGGELIALLGGGPTARGDDAFHRFAALLPPRTAPRLGDPRASSEAGWRELMPRARIAPFERWELDASGTFDDVWTLLGASYDLDPVRGDELRAALRAATAEWGERIPCTVVGFLAQAIVITAESTP